MKPSRTAAVLLLSLISGSGWLFTQLFPGRLAYPFSACIHFLLIALIAVAATLRLPRPRTPAILTMKLALAGTALFALPAILIQLTAGAVSEFFSIAAFCAIPAITLLLLSASSATSALSSRDLIAAVAGLGGALRLFPVTLPTSLRGWTCAALLMALCVAVAAACIRLHRLMQATPLPSAIATATIASAIALGLYGTTIGWPAMTLRIIAVECLRCIVFDLPVVWLTLWLIRETSPRNLSARFLLAPFITALEGFAILRDGLDLAAIIAILVMATGGATLLVGSDRQEFPSLHLR